VDAVELLQSDEHALAVLRHLLDASRHAAREVAAHHRDDLLAAVAVGRALPDRAPGGVVAQRLLKRREVALADGPLECTDRAVDEDRQRWRLVIISQARSDKLLLASAPRERAVRVRCRHISGLGRLAWDDRTAAHVEALPYAVEG
jgi:hypothetical protein